MSPGSTQCFHWETLSLLCLDVISGSAEDQEFQRRMVQFLSWLAPGEIQELLEPIVASAALIRIRPWGTCRPSRWAVELMQRAEDARKRILELAQAADCPPASSGGSIIPANPDIK